MRPRAGILLVALLVASAAEAASQIQSAARVTVSPPVVRLDRIVALEHTLQGQVIGHYEATGAVPTFMTELQAKGRSLDATLFNVNGKTKGAA